MPIAKPAPKKKKVVSKELTREGLMAALNDRYKTTIIRTASDPFYEIERIPTGILSIDCLTGGGFARNRYTELYGSAHVGKTFVTFCLIANAQALGLRCAFVDVEGTVDPDFMEHCGIDLAALDMIPHNHANQAVDLIEALLASELYDVIVLDSIASLLPKSEMESDMEAASMGMEQAKLMSKALRKLTVANKKTALVFINQTRQAVGASAFAKQSVTSGGKAMAFYAGQRIELTRIETIKVEGKVVNPSNGEFVKKSVPTGHRVLARVEKDKTGGAKPLEETSFIYDYDIGGVDVVADLILQGRTYGLVHKKGSGNGERWWVQGYEEEEQTGRARFRGWLADNVAVAEELDELIRDAASEKFATSL